MKLLGRPKTLFLQSPATPVFFQASEHTEFDKNPQVAAWRGEEALLMKSGEFERTMFEVNESEYLEENEARDLPTPCLKVKK